MRDGRMTHPKSEVECKKYGPKVGTRERQTWAGEQVLEVRPWAHHSREGCEEQCRSQRPPGGKFVSQSCMPTTAGTGSREVCFGISWKWACALQVTLTSHRARNWLFGVSCEIDSLCAPGSCRKPSLFPPDRTGRRRGPRAWDLREGCTALGILGRGQTALSPPAKCSHGTQRKHADLQNDEFRRL